MATTFYGVNAGAEDNTVTVSATTTSKDVEVVINTNANVPTRDALLIALERLQVAIVRAPYPPV